jgi:hypothetical protein
MALFGDEVRVFLPTGNLLDENVERQGFGNLEELLAFKS